jgi:D-alanyl-D-alanine carboxypeptidase/D-alanyl-D-alanine-endopeptidase (penicillin-binding protein 4)
MRNKILKNAFVSLLILGIFSINLLSQNSFKSNIFTYEDTLKSLKFLSGQISRVITSAGFKNTKYAIAVYSLDNKKYYFKKNAKKPLTPASLTKLFTCYSALFTLGTDFEYVTDIYHSGNNVNGIINGDVYIVGSGDPMFSTNDLRSMVRQIVASGIKEIKGSIIADGTFFDDITDRLNYSGDKDRVQGVQPVTGLSINKNIVTVTIHGIPQGKKRSALVTTDPPSPAFRIINKSRVKGRPKRKSKKKTFWGEPQLLNQYGGPAETHSTARRRSTYIKHRKDANGKQVFTASGTINADRTYSYSYFINNPDEVIAGALLRSLNEGGVKVSGTFKTGKLQDVTTPIYKLAESKRYLVDVISPALKNSDNYLAENIFKLIGAHSGKMVENAKESKMIIRNVLDSMNIDFDKCVLYDGSGLSRRNKLTAVAGIKLLINATNNENINNVIDSSLSVAGCDGTLKKRMRHTLAADNLKAKTGTHRNVSGLCGIVKTLDGERLAFCFIFNGPSVGLYKQLENKLGIILAQFFYFNRES